METTRKRQRRTERHAARLSQESLSRAGRRKDVASALSRDASTVRHECTTRAHPALAEAFAVLVNLIHHPKVNGRAFAEAVSEAVELAEIIDADTDKLVARGFWLIEQENLLDGLEDSASLRTTEAHAAALRAHASHAWELAAIEAELLERRVDLLGLYRAKAAA